MHDSEQTTVMADLPQTSYDEVPYESHPFPQTHPDRLTTVATLLGMQPAKVEHCRVLELGCAAGGNLIPMADALPESTFLGIDLSRRQIQAGQALVDSLGLQNLELKHMDIAEVDEGFGKFDYIICHGVYSWVPSSVQARILEICAANLSPSGVAYVSYNTNPGWHMRGMIRDMMHYHARQFSDPQVRINQARNLLTFMAKSAAQEQTPYGLLLQSELRMVQQSRDSYLFHEHLEEVNEPVYFHQFAERAAAKGLRYLGEADLRVMVPSNFAPEVENVLQMLSSDIIHMEQYMDFLRNRMFRQTLLCHKEVPLNYQLRAERLAAFHVASPLRPLAAKPDLQSAEYEKFQAPNGATMSVNQPLAKAALLHLSTTWPRFMPVPQLRMAARELLNLSADDQPNVVAADLQIIGQHLLAGFTSAAPGLIELQLSAPRYTLDVSDRPRASRLARLQAESGYGVTNLRHETAALDEAGRQILLHLDGNADRGAILDTLARLVSTGTLSVQENGTPVTGDDHIRAALDRGLAERLRHLAASALLVA